MYYNAIILYYSASLIRADIIFYRQTNFFSPRAHTRLFKLAYNIIISCSVSY